MGGVEVVTLIVSFEFLQFDTTRRYENSAIWIEGVDYVVIVPVTVIV